MKKFTLLLIVVIVMIAISSCNKVEGPYLETNNQIEADSVFPPLTNPYQKIFLEEFTGQTCINCPSGHKKAADLKTRFGDTLVLMAIHAGNFAEPTIAPYTADFRTEAGDALNASFGVQGYPAGMVNRTMFNNHTVLGTSEWTAASNAINRTSPKLAIQLKVVDYSSDNSVKVYAKTTFLQAVQQNIKLAIFITEDSIVSPQMNNTVSIGPVPDIIDYVHRHMLRETVNSVWGDEISNSASAATINSFVLKGYSFSFAGKPYVKNHCSIIAVACDVDSKEVLQVEEIHLSH